MTGGDAGQGIHCLVSGRVQGVCFRAETQAQARRLGLGGWVRNLPDGRVELEAHGRAAALATLRAWLQHGPANARVLKLECKAMAWQAHDDFIVRPTQSS